MSYATHQTIYHIYACLPFVELAHESTIKMGPISFWPASKYKSFLPSEAHDNFRKYIQSIGQIKAQTEEQKNKWINTVRLAPQGTTCISIEETIEPSFREFLLIDSLYLLYFACTFRNLYYNNEIPSFDVFRKMIPASLEFINNKVQWEHLHIDEIHREKTVCLHLFDQEICTALGKMLWAIYHPQNPISPSALQNYKRLIRSIRYLVDRFFQRFVNLLGKGLNFPEKLFEPEDVIFLVSSFEALFDINDRHPNADLKHKLRPLLHLKYSRPLEIFWKWIDDFYEAKRKIIHGGLIPNLLFKENPNFEVSHILIGVKVFIYSAYYTLFKYHLIPSETFNAYTPPDFKWIHREEMLLFFWTESNLLQKLNTFIKQTRENPHQEELYADIYLLSNLFISMYEHYYKDDYPHPEIKFIPTPLKELESLGHHILQHIEEEKKQEHSLLLKHLPPEFTLYLAKRIERHVQV
jgi:hypothetical protein